MTDYEMTLYECLAKRGGGGGGGGLPAGYRQVACLRSSGVQWIETGLYFTGSKLKFEADAAGVKQSSEHDLFGCYNSGHNKIIIGIASSQWFLYSRRNDNATADTSAHAALTGTRQHIEFLCDRDAGTKTLTVDAETDTETLTSDTGYSALPFVLFMGGFSGTSAYKLGMYTLYYAKVWHDGVLVRDYVPCVREADGKPGMYDMCGSVCSATGTPFYVNGGTGLDFEWREIGGYDIDFEVTTIAEQLTYSFQSKANTTFECDWGDGTVETITAEQARKSHTYAEAGTYRIRIQDALNITQFVPGDNNDSAYTPMAKLVGHVYKFNAVYSNNMFRNCENMTMDELRSDLTSIPNKAFMNCTSLDLTSLPTGITTLGSDAFYKCTRLALESVPPNLVSIGANAFFQCGNITVASLPDTVTTIGDSAFSDCTKLALSSLPANLTKIGSSVFRACSNITLTSLPSGITSIGQSAFSGCTKLALTSLPSGVTSIPQSAFATCTNLALTSLPSGVTSIGNSAFQNCTNLALTELPSGVTSIGQSAFRGCTNLALTSLPSGLTTISANSFQDCASAAIASLPPLLTSIAAYAFSGSGVVFAQIPASVTTLDSSCMAGCTGLTTLSFLGTPTSIAAQALRYCTNITDIYVPWSQGDIADAPWGATNAHIWYNHTT